MKYKKGDIVYHKTNPKQKMMIVDIAVEEIPPTNRHNDLVGSGLIAANSYYCTWVTKGKKSEGYFTEIELASQ